MTGISIKYLRTHEIKNDIIKNQDDNVKNNHDNVKKVNKLINNNKKKYIYLFIISLFIIIFLKLYLIKLYIYN
tara:strand:- start:8410 stop:8628 length:219 start_codon:yes stop_codon:yes gene_type:complete